MSDEHTPAYDSHIRLKQTQDDAFASAEAILRAVQELPPLPKKKSA